MKRTLICLSIVTLLSACSSLKGSGSNGGEAIANQKLSTSFVSEGIKIETKCNWWGMGSDCKVVAIEAVGTAPSFGNTVTNRKIALTRAEMRANANVAEFLHKEISTNRVNTVISKNIEKAKDIARQGGDASEVAMSDQEAKNVSLRENNNDTVMQLTETIRTSSTAILKGFVKIREEVVGQQEVSVTIRWDLESNNSRDQLARIMR